MGGKTSGWCMCDILTVNDAHSGQEVRMWLRHVEKCVCLRDNLQLKPSALSGAFSEADAHFSTAAETFTSFSPLMITTILGVFVNVSETSHGATGQVFDGGETVLRFYVFDVEMKQTRRYLWERRQKQGHWLLLWDVLSADPQMKNSRVVNNTADVGLTRM